MAFISEVFHPILRTDRLQMIFLGELCQDSGPLKRGNTCNKIWGFTIVDPSMYYNQQYGKMVGTAKGWKNHAVLKTHGRWSLNMILSTKIWVGIDLDWMLRGKLSRWIPFGNITWNFPTSFLQVWCLRTIFGDQTSQIIRNSQQMSVIKNMFPPFSPHFFPLIFSCQNPQTFSEHVSTFFQHFPKRFPTFFPTLSERFPTFLPTFSHIFPPFRTFSHNFSHMFPQEVRHEWCQELSLQQQQLKEAEEMRLVAEALAKEALNIGTMALWWVKDGILMYFEWKNLVKKTKLNGGFWYN